MPKFSPVASYVLGAACFGRGLMALIWPEEDYAHVGLPLESEATPPYDGPSLGFVSPLMYFKGIREMSYGATLIALQWGGNQRDITTFATILSFVRFGDGLVVWLKGGEKLRYRASGHWITGAGFLWWVLWRWNRLGYFRWLWG
ncbi:uncharacterized protein F4822DRAFT_416113 [Hypoxylon trugodes]|uniref:uncharacterized protein n=1 Tax=Hypoxylon trugodes TaxID=326681 RepID=UPI00219FCF84|nr:uncharacterized protein F4822DRAFT_416113 [Hypoxylon trugodes]KAI1384741.1 hypothetical protein F4822DRAFT_416113 [Hypoxylon trugodes]